MSQDPIHQALRQLEQALGSLEQAAQGVETKLKAQPKAAPAPANTGAKDLFGMPLKAGRRGAAAGSPIIDPSLMAKKLDSAISRMDRILKDEAV